MLADHARPTCPLPAVAFRPEGAGGTVGAGLIVRIKLAEPVPLGLIALSVTVLVPVADGVPLMAPVLVFTLKPAGRPDAPKLVEF